MDAIRLFGDRSNHLMGSPKPTKARSEFATPMSSRRVRRLFPNDGSNDSSPCSSLHSSPLKTKEAVRDVLSPEPNDSNMDGGIIWDDEDDAGSCPTSPLEVQTLSRADSFHLTPPQFRTKSMMNFTPPKRRKDSDDMGGFSFSPPQSSSDPFATKPLTSISPQSTPPNGHGASLGIENLYLSPPRPKRKPFEDISATPPKKSKAQDKSPETQVTPVKVRNLEAMIGESSLDLSLLKASKEILESGFNALATVPEPKKTSLATRISKAVFSRVEPENPLDPYQQVRGSDWAPRVLGRLKSMAPNHESAGSTRATSNLTHIGNIENRQGWHYCNQNDPRFQQLIEIRMNQQTGIFIADFARDDSGEIKQSSFFPATIESIDQVVEIIEKAKVISTNDRKMQQLCLAEYNGIEFYIMKFIRQNGVFSNSLFPLLFVGDLDLEEESFEMQGLMQISKEEILQHLFSEIRKGRIGELKQFEQEDRYLFDLASILNIRGIKKGICFWIHRNNIPADVIQEGIDSNRASFQAKANQKRRVFRQLDFSSEREQKAN